MSFPEIKDISSGDYDKPKDILEYDIQIGSSKQIYTIEVLLGETEEENKPIYILDRKESNTKVERIGYVTKENKYTFHRYIDETYIKKYAKNIAEVDEEAEEKSDVEENEEADVEENEEADVEKEADLEETQYSNKGAEQYTSREFIRKVPEMAKTLYDPEIVFRFYSKSADVYPGSGKGKSGGESLDKSKRDEYKELNQIKDWRKKLSNFWVEPFTLDGKQWASVEHYYHAAKFKKNNPQFYHLFSLDSKSELSKFPHLAKGAGGTSGKIKGKQFREKHIKIDDDIFKGNHRELDEMYRAQFAKFTQSPSLHDMLLKTKDAKLVHILSRSSKVIVFDNLMVIRDLIKQEKIKKIDL